ncbi:polymerase-associated phosphoprotein [Nephotettix cincticeps negative-stranded RNA virus 1]|nr:polymerase-associated phosphoprotein [Nephotettix cincticeps negative-stranded RNA virus 1]
MSNSKKKTKSKKQEEEFEMESKAQSIAYLKEQKALGVTMSHLYQELDELEKAAGEKISDGNLMMAPKEEPPPLPGPSSSASPHPPSIMHKGIPSTESAVGWVIKNLPKSTLALELQTSKLIVPSQYLETLCEQLRNPMPLEEYKMLCERLVLNLHGIAVGAALQAELSIKQLESTIENLRSEMSSMRELFTDVIESGNKNMSSFQNESSSVCKEMRALIQKVEKMYGEKKERANPNLSKFYTVDKVSETEITFTLCDSLCYIRIKSVHPHDVKVKGWKASGVTKDSAQAFVETLKIMPANVLPRLRGIECKQHFLEFVKRSSSSSDDNITTLTQILMGI